MRELMMTGDIAALLGCTRQNAQLVVKRPGFPKPYGVAGTHRVWLGSDVRRWAAQHT
jgi:predicted DNA-binding transcriptional regulator AlpA